MCTLLHFPDARCPLVSACPALGVEWRLQAGLREHAAKDYSQTLARHGIDSRMVPEGDKWALEIPLRGKAAATHRQYLRLLHIRGIVEEEARRQDLPMEPYKAFEPASVFTALAAADIPDEPRALDADEAAKVWHELVWAQGFANGNHRTATAYVEALANPRAGSVRTPLGEEAGLLTLFKESKALIPEKEFAPDPSKAKSQHHEASRRFFRGWLSLEGAR